MRSLLLIGALGLALAGCGTSTTDRAITGGGLGAGVGAAGAAITGGNVGTAAVVGGAVGAAVGAITDADDIYLGRPIWRR